MMYKKENNTPWQSNMEPKNGGLEDDFPFSIKVIFGFHSNFQGCKKPSKMMSVPKIQTWHFLAPRYTNPRAFINNSLENSASGNKVSASTFNS